MTRSKHDEAGTTALEVAAMVPVVVAMAFALIQVAFAAYGITATQTASRQGARALSLGQDPTYAVERALPSWLHVDEMNLYGPGNGVEVRVDLPDLIPGTDLFVTRRSVMP